MNSLRFIDFDTHTSSIRLELPFWETIDRLAGGKDHWQYWAKEQLKSKPRTCGMTSWLRQVSHNALVQERDAEKGVRALRFALLCDLWTPEQACYIFAGLLDSDKALNGKPSTTTQKKEAHQFLTLWRASDHKPRAKEKHGDLWAKEYCVRWAARMNIEIPWFFWAVEEDLIFPLDVIQGYPSNSIVKKVEKELENDVT